MKKIAVIGAGFSGLSAATYLAHAGYDVTVFEKNSTAGGRARQLTLDGFTFDMGPSWYWMPDIFEQYFRTFGKRTEQYYQLRRLDPSYRVYFGEKDFLDLPATENKLIALFESIETGAGARLKLFLAEAQSKYEIATREFMHKPGLSWLEFVQPRLLPPALKLQLFKSMSAHVRKYFQDPRLISILEFPVLFLGASPDKTPALYSLMNYADMSLGTWYPDGGMYSVVKGFVKLAEESGVRFRYESPVKGLEFNDNRITGVHIEAGLEQFDCVVASADYQHIEQELLPAHLRRYTKSYWDSRVLAPSSLLFYLGVNKELSNLLHHTLFFDTSFGVHAEEIYNRPAWPSAPQFYVSCASKTDQHISPSGQDGIVVLIPIAPGLEDIEGTRERFYEMIMDRLEKLTGQTVKENVVVKRSYSINDFITDYHSFKGNAYGLANTLSQTAVLKPSIVNNKIPNLFYCGQLTVPGPGVPTAVLSGQIAAQELIRRAK